MQTFITVIIWNVATGWQNRRHRGREHPDHWKLSIHAKELGVYAFGKGELSKALSRSSLSVDTALMVLMDLQKSRLEWEMPAGQLRDSCNKPDTDEGQEEMEWSKAERDKWYNFRTEWKCGIKNKVQGESQVFNLGDWDQIKGILPSRKFRKIFTGKWCIRF